MNIRLTPEIEKVLGDLAEKQGTSIELLAIQTLRQRFLADEMQSLGRTMKRPHDAKTLADLLCGYIGIIDSGEILKGGAQMSKNTGKKFTELLMDKRRQGRL
jgi:hypothetical protein